MAIWEDGMRLSHVAEVSAQGNPPPLVDPHSETGYVDNQRYFLGSSWRSETFRWIELTEKRETDPRSASNVAKPFSLYTTLLRGMSHAAKLYWSIPFGVAVEKVALVGPLVLQLSLLALAAFGIARGSGAVAGIFFATVAFLAPPVCQQFLPGVLEPEGTALLLAFSAVVYGSSSTGQWAESKRRWVGWMLSIFCITAAIGLSPSAGFTGLLAITLWCGGVLFQSQERGSRWRLKVAMLCVVFLTLLALGIVPRARSYLGWDGESETLQHVTALDAGPVVNFFAWGAVHSALEVMVLVVPAMAVVALAVWTWLIEERGESRSRLILGAVLVTACFVLGLFRVRWMVMADLLAVWAMTLLFRRSGEKVSTRMRAVFFSLLGVVALILSADRLSSLRSTHDQSMELGDVEAMVARDLTQWLLKHTPRGQRGILAPPEMSDALVYFGNVQGLITTDVEGRKNALTASRILSAVLLDEAESLLHKHGINYIIVPSWDKVLSHLVRTPEDKRKFALLPRLEHWAPPRILRPIPYHLPPAAGMEGQALAVYQVVDAQEESVALSRLAEYFAEIGNAHLAKAAATVLGTSFPGDPNASIARAIVYQTFGEKTDFERELSAVAAIDAENNEDLDWDRCVQRGIVLALGGKREEAKRSISHCIADASEARLYSLTPLELYRLNVIAKAYRLSYPTPDLDDLSGRISDRVVEMDVIQPSKRPSEN